MPAAPSPRKYPWPVNPDSTSSSSAAAAAACAPRAWPRSAARASPWPKPPPWAAPASTSAAFRRSCMPTPRTTRTISPMPPASAGTWASRASTGPGSRPTAPREIARLNGVYERLLSDAGVQVLRGWAELVDGHTVRVRTEAGPQTHSARHILLATGGTPAVPAIAGARTGRHLGQHVRPGAVPPASGGGRRRLHRLRVRLDLPGAGRPGHAAVPGRADPARLRRRSAAVHRRPVDPQRHRPAPGHRGAGDRTRRRRARR